MNTVPPRPFPRPALLLHGIQVDEGGWPPLCSSQLPAQVKSKGGALLWTTALPEWLGLISLKSGFQSSPRFLRILPCLCDHAKSADRKYSLSKFLFYVTFNYKAQTLQKNECKQHPILPFVISASKTFFFLGFFHPS